MMQANSLAATKQCCSICKYCCNIGGKLYCSKYGLKETFKYNSCTWFDFTPAQQNIADVLIGSAKSGGVK